MMRHLGIAYVKVGVGFRVTRVMWCVTMCVCVYTRVFLYCIPIFGFVSVLALLQGCTSMSDIGQRPTEFEKCPFDFSVERTNALLLTCQFGHCCL